MNEHKKKSVPITDSERKKLESTWLELCVYRIMTAELTTPSNSSLFISGVIDEVEVFRVEVNPPELVEPFLNLVNAYTDIAYHKCDVQAWREWANLQVGTLKKLPTLTLKQRVDQELLIIYSLAKGEQAYNLTETIFPLLSQLVGEQPPTLISPSLDKVRQIFGQYLKHFYQFFGDNEINECIEFYDWLASEASDNDLRLFVSIMGAYGCIQMASFVSKLIELAIQIGKGKETSPLRLVKEAVTNPVAEAVLELVAVFQGLGGDSNSATGTLWDAGIHPLAKKVPWQQIQKPNAVAGRLVIKETVHDAVCHLLDAIQTYLNSVTVADLLFKARSPHLLNSIKKASFNLLITKAFRGKRRIEEVPISKARGEMGQIGEHLLDEEVLARLLLKQRRQPLIEEDISSDIDNRLDIEQECEQIASDPSLTPRERQVLLLRISIARDEKRMATMNEMAQKIGVTTVRIHQLWHSMCQKLQHNKRII